jgi:peptidoglycan/xylan/chitin deacetylase (PgdA/CDA1 family)
MKFNRMTAGPLAGLVIVTLALIIMSCGHTPKPTTPGDMSSPQAVARQDEAAQQQEAEEEKKPLIANDDFSNLQLGRPDRPVYDACTLAERREKGLPTALPTLIPYRGGKIAYLTFDDGPDGKNTPAILDILKEAGIRATFYVTGAQAEAHPDMLKRIYEEGHAIGNHSYDHRYENLYPNVNGYLAEMQKTDEIIRNLIGVRPLITRAPGGRPGHFTKEYPSVLKANGYVEHDWNVSSADAAPHHPVAQDFIDNIDGQSDKPAVQSACIILLHCSEGHEETVKALPEILRLLQEKGYTFGVITPMTPQPW